MLTWLTLQKQLLLNLSHCLFRFDPLLAPNANCWQIVPANIMGGFIQPRYEGNMSRLIRSAFVNIEISAAPELSTGRTFVVEHSASTALE
jgi:hypothetical protein